MFSAGEAERLLMIFTGGRVAQNRKNWLAATVAGAALAALSGPALSAGIDSLRPHLAVYDVNLLDASDRTGINDMRGRIVYEMTGSKCEGFAVRYRFLLNVQTGRKTMVTDQRSTSFEAGDGKSFSFVQQSYLNGQLEKDLRGKAHRSAGSTEVEISKPAEQKLSLGNSVFMAQHMGMIVDAALAKESIVEAKVFDGSDEGDAVMNTTAIIGAQKSQAISVEGEPKAVADQFSGTAVWPVSVSYFTDDDSQNAGEKLPVYQVSFLMHETGVSRDLKLRYTDYSLKGQLTKFEYLDYQACKDDQ